MAEHRRVTDQEILEGFKSLQDAMATGLATMNARFEAMDARFEAMDARFDAMDARFDALRTEMNQRFGEFEHRMLRRFDEVDARFDRVEQRLGLP